METCTPRPNISIRSAHSVPNLYFDINRTFESALTNAEAVLNECDESGQDDSYSKCNGYNINTSNNNICNPQEIEIVIPCNDDCDDPFQRNTVRKSRKRYRAPPPPAAITQKTLPNSKYARNRNQSLDLLIVNKPDSTDLTTKNYDDEEDNPIQLGFGSRSDDVRMSVMQRKAILEKQLKLRTNGPLDESLQGSLMKGIGSERKNLNKDNPNEFEGELTAKSVDVHKDVKRPFIPPPPPPPKIPALTQTTNHPRQQSESRLSNSAHSDDKDDRNGCDTCVDWVLFLLCIA